MKGPPLVRVGVCADDFGLSRLVDDAILDLAWHWRITAVSCLVDGPSFAGRAPDLALLRGSGVLDVGLHLNLTESFGGEHGPRERLPRLVARAYAGTLGRDGLAREIRRQLARFEDSFGFAPDHVDGHQHVHQLPVVRRVLLDELARRPGPRPWVRQSAPRWRALGSGTALPERGRAMLIGALGAAGLGRLLARERFAANQRLLGVYSPHCDVEGYVARVHGWLHGARDGDLLMCHPRAPARSDLLGVIGGTAEYRVLASGMLPALLAQHGVGVVRMSRLLGCKAAA